MDWNTFEKRRSLAESHVMISWVWVSWARRLCRVTLDLHVTLDVGRAAVLLSGTTASVRPAPSEVGPTHTIHMSVNVQLTAGNLL